jgi:outer membrane protein TolC
MKALMLINLLLITLPLQALMVSETALLKEAINNSPRLDQIESAHLQAKAKEAQIKDQFNTNLKGKALYSKTNEKQFSPFAPVTSPIKAYEVGLERNIIHGMNLGVSATNQQISNNFFQNGTTATVGASLSLDLYKNFLGRASKSQLGSASESVYQTLKEAEVQKKTFLNGLRKIYWALVANEEALKVTRKLLITSKRQVKEAKRRLKNKIADRGEVARYHSQVASRQANIISLEFRKSQLIQNIKELIPQWAMEKIELVGYNTEETIAEVLSCSALISQSSEAPLKYTYLDEIVESLKKQEELDYRYNSLHSKADLKLLSEFKYVGKDFDHGDSYSDLTQNGKPSYSVGIQFTIPLGGKKKVTQEILQKIVRKTYRARQNQGVGKLKAYHSQVIRSIQLLQEVVRNQQENTRYLEQSLKISEKKYRQARLTVQQLVQEQDAYLQSNLDEIQTKLSVIHTLLDYLSVYTETPCSLNKPFYL